MILSIFWRSAALSKNKGHNFEMAEAIWLVIETGCDVIPINSFPKFPKDWTTTVLVRDQASLWTPPTMDVPSYTTYL